MSVPGATIRAMSGDLERMPAAAAAAAPVTGPALLAAELLIQYRPTSMASAAGASRYRGFAARLVPNSRSWTRAVGRIRTPFTVVYAWRKLGSRSSGT
jgi:hypothetical protein